MVTVSTFYKPSCYVTVIPEKFLVLVWTYVEKK